MSNITEYFIIKREDFFNSVVRDVHKVHPDIVVKKEDTDRILLSFGLELADGRVMILRSENFNETYSPGYQLGRMVEAFYNIDWFDGCTMDYIWPWRNHTEIMDRFNTGDDTSLINRQYHTA